MNYTHIIFDIDGTLLDTEYAVLHSMQDTLKAMANIDMPVSELTFALGITGADALEILHVENREAVLAQWEKSLSDYHDTIRVFPGIRQVLDTLSSRGYELGIVTSKTRKEFDDDFCPFGIRDYFHYVICADDTTEHKPLPGPLRKYMELSGASASELLYIGDTEYDRRCSEGAGVDFALAAWGNATGKIAAKYILQTPGDLPACL